MSFPGATGVLHDSVDELVSPVSKATGFVCSADSLGMLNEPAGVEIGISFANVAGTGVDPVSSLGVKLLTVPAGDVEGDKLGSLEHVEMSDSDTKDLGRVLTGSAKQDFGGVD